MNKLLAALVLCSFCSIQGSSATNKVTEVVDEYSFKMVLRVPRTYDNTQSLGYRKYQTQTVKGLLRIVYSADGEGRKTYIEVADLVNKTHKVLGCPVTYLTYVGNDSDWPTRIGYIGSNKTGQFKTPFVSFSMDANPSYNVGADEPDNALILRLSGQGTSKLVTWNGYKDVRIIKTLVGTLSGDLGCGCTAYGHKSCTRTAAWYGPTDDATDIAAIGKGTWRATWSRRYMRTCEVDPDDY